VGTGADAVPLSAPSSPHAGSADHEAGERGIGEREHARVYPNARSNAAAASKTNACVVVSAKAATARPAPAPGAARQWGSPAPSGSKRIYSRADIAAAHHAYMKGAYKGREAEYEALQADFVAAGREGRISDLPVAKGKALFG